jgi:hypothetical protein
MTSNTDVIWANRAAKAVLLIRFSSDGSSFPKAFRNSCSRKRWEWGVPVLRKACCLLSRQSEAGTQSSLKCPNYSGYWYAGSLAIPYRVPIPFPWLCRLYKRMSILAFDLPISARYHWRAYSCRCLVPFSSPRFGCLS